MVLQIPVVPPLIRGMPSFTRLTTTLPDYNYEAIIKAANHPECKFNPREMADHLTPVKIEKAFEFLASKGASTGTDH